MEDGVLSFYEYDDISELIKYKYNRFGSRVFWEIAKPLKEFAKNYKEKGVLIPIDDNIKKGYSHTAILAKSLESSFLHPQFGSLLAKNDVKYAGKSLEFRLKNKKDFYYTGKKNIKAILVDDIYTTGTTISEAKEVLAKSGVEVEFSIVLSKVRR